MPLGNFLMLENCLVINNIFGILSNQILIATIKPLNRNEDN
jgi:hypothetical protein